MTRDQYMSLITEWRKSYQAISEDIRLLRTEFKEAQRSFSKDETLYGKSVSSLREYERAKDLATEEIKLLHALKKKAAEEWRLKRLNQST